MAAEEDLQREELKQKFELEKRDKLADFEERLRLAKGDSNFQQVLEEYQEAQRNIEKKLKKDFDKQNKKLEDQLKARRARRKNQAQLKKAEMFNEIEKQAEEEAALDAQNHEKLKQNLKAADADEGGYATYIATEVNTNELLIDEMEQKRRDEEAFSQQHERDQRQLAGENARLARKDDTLIEQEIKKLANGEVFGEFQTHVNERQRLQDEIANAQDDDERARLVAELNQVDENVRRQLAEQQKEQDKALADKLAARRARRNKAIEDETAKKKSQI